MFLRSCVAIILGCFRSHRMTESYRRGRAAALRYPVVDGVVSIYGLTAPNGARRRLLAAALPPNYRLKGGWSPATRPAPGAGFLCSQSVRANNPIGCESAQARTPVGRAFRRSRPLAARSATLIAPVGRKSPSSTASARPLWREATANRDSTTEAATPQAAREGFLSCIDAIREQIFSAPPQVEIFSTEEAQFQLPFRKNSERGKLAIE